MKWMEILPYHHEVVHTSVLRHLLNDWRGDERIEFLRRVTGNDSIVGVRNARFETSLVKGRRLDLVADLEMDSGEVRNLAVEMKADSPWNWKQLTDSAPGDAVALLLSVGLTHLTVRGSELDAVKKSKKHSPDWHACGPGQLATVIEDTFKAKRDLGSYINALREEEALHQASIEDVELLSTDHRWDPSRLEHLVRSRGDRNNCDEVMLFAYFKQALEVIDAGPEPDWHWNRSRSGPAVIRAAETDRRNNWPVWLELRGDGGKGPELCVKLGAVRGTSLADRRDEKREQLAAAGVAGQPTTRHVSASHKTTTAWSLDLWHTKPSEIEASVRAFEAVLLD